MSLLIRTTTSISTIKQLCSAFMFSLMSDLNGLNRWNKPEKISMSKKAVPKTTPTHYVQLLLDRPMVVWRCLPARVNIPEISHWPFLTPKTNPNKFPFGLFLFEMTWHQFVLHFFLEIYQLKLKKQANPKLSWLKMSVLHEQKQPV